MPSPLDLPIPSDEEYLNFRHIAERLGGPRGIIQSSWARVIEHFQFALAAGVSPKDGRASNLNLDIRKLPRRISRRFEAEVPADAGD